MFLSIIEFLCRSIRYKFPQCRLLPYKLKAIDKIAVKEVCVMMVAKVI